MKIKQVPDKPQEVCPRQRPRDLQEIWTPENIVQSGIPGKETAGHIINNTEYSILIGFCNTQQFTSVYD